MPRRIVLLRAAGVSGPQPAAQVRALWYTTRATLAISRQISSPAKQLSAIGIRVVHGPVARR